VADEHDRLAVQRPDTGDQRAVVGPAAIAVQLDPVVEQPRDVVERVRAVLVAGSSTDRQIVSSVVSALRRSS